MGNPFDQFRISLADYWTVTEMVCGVVGLPRLSSAITSTRSLSFAPANRALAMKVGQFADRESVDVDRDRAGHFNCSPSVGVRYLVWTIHRMW
jgi:hypothetical protein